MRASGLICLCLVLLLASPARAGLLGDPYFETVGDTESIPNGVVTCVAQDARGLIWVGTQAGLLRFDGYRFQHHQHDPNVPNSLGENSVRDLLAMEDGTLWVATQGGGVSIYDPGNDQFERLQNDPADPNSLSDRAVLTLEPDGSGGVWLGTANHGLDHWEPQRRVFRHYPPDPQDPGALPDGTVRSLLRDRDGDLWVGTRDGLARLRSGATGFEPVASDPGDPTSLHGRYVYSLFQDSQGRIWAGTQNHGLVVIDPHQGSVVGRLTADEPDGLSHPWVSNMLQPLPGQVWVLTFGAGIDVVDDATLRVQQRIRHDPAVPSSLALDLPTQPLIDRSGLLWIGTWGAGLQRFNPTARAFASFRHSPLRRDGLSNAAVHAALAWDDGRIWLGTGGNGIDVLHREQGFLPGLRADPRRPGALRDGTIRALARTSDGSVWVGSQQAGLHRWLGEDQGFRVVPGAGGDDDERIVLLRAMRNGALLVASQRGAAELDPASENITPLVFENGEPFSDTVISFVDDADGHLWIASAIGLLVRPAGTPGLRRVWAAPGKPGGLSHDSVLSLHLDDQDRLWLGTAAGIDRLIGWDEGVPQFAALPLGGRRAAVAFGGNRLLSDRQGRLWTERLMIDPESARVHEFGRPDGVDLGSVSLGAATRLPDGQLLFGGTRGFVLVEPEAYRPWTFNSAPVVTTLRVDGVPLPLERLQDGLVLAPEERRLEIEFSALDFSAPERVRYAYRLEGLEADWVEGDAGSRAAHYSKLWPDRYTLRARASNRNGVWSDDELVIPLRVLPAWWQTPAFVLLLVLLVVVALLAGVRLRTARIRARAATLETLVQQRTSELSQAKEHAEHMLAELQGTQKQLVAAEKMASLGQLVAGVAHEINTPIGIAVTASSHLDEMTQSFAAKIDQGKLTRSDFASWRISVEEVVRLILGSLQRANVLIGSFKQVAVDQSSEQRRHVELASFLREVEFTLKPSYRRSAHELEIDCPPGIELDTYPGALFQIFTNLVNNALLHGMTEGQPGHMRIRARADGDRVSLVFSDDGRGMSPEVANRAFDPFFTTRRGTGGSGLGLHLVYNLVTRLLGGQIELRSTPGVGTEFELRIPRTAPEHGPGDAHAAAFRRG